MNLSKTNSILHKKEISDTLRSVIIWFRFYSSHKFAPKIRFGGHSV